MASRSVHFAGVHAPSSVSSVELTTKELYLSAYAGPAAGAALPALSIAVPAAIEMPSAPSPETLVKVTVRVAPLPESTLIVAVAEPVVTNVTFAVVSVL